VDGACDGGGDRAGPRALQLLHGRDAFTLVVPPILAIAQFLSVLVVTVVTVDGQADMVAGAALVGLYVIIATISWWDSINSTGDRPCRP